MDKPINMTTMKKTLLFLPVLMLTSALVFGGGILTNTNQSAGWVRLPARNATLGLDAVYYNPAGLNLLPSNGFFVSLNNQVIGQKRTITSTYQLLNESEYIGNVSAPIFPGVYAGYKTDKFAVSFGFNPMGGGGGATYDNGVPSFEYPLTDLVPGLTALGVTGLTGYRADIFFEGTSVFFGYQLNFSYKITDMLSVALGGRYITAKETYAGHLKDIEVNYNGTWTRADGVLNGLASQASTGATLATTAAAGMQPLIDAGAGGMTFQEAQDAFIIDALTRGTLEGGLTALGIDPTGLTLAQAQGAYQTAYATLTEQATEASMQAKLLRDQEADAEKTGSGFTPIISVNFHPSEKLNIAIKYEHKTKLELKNNTVKDITLGYTPTGDSITQFPDGAKARLDIPSQISLGVTYRPIDKLLISADMYYYLEKDADWEGKEEFLDANSLELALGLQYNISDKLAVSGGFLYTKPGPTKEYQTDLSYYTLSNNIGLGAAYKINDMLEIELGGAYVMYQDDEKDFTRNTLPYTETYGKSSWIVAAGINLFFSK